MAYLELKSIKKSFGPVPVVKSFDLAVDKGEFVSFLGPSGCGKTTVLRMIAGFEAASSGTIEVDGQEISNLPPAKRKIGMVFQAYALFPNMTVAQNVGFGLKLAGYPADQMKARVGEMLEMIKLPHLGDRYPYQLSGGQQQRVALARALAVRPKILLLDEPLSALDAKIRVSLREEIRSLQRQMGITTIFVTHDQEEALSISDRIVVMYEGAADQIGTPFEIYNTPKTTFVASFVGTLNLLEATVVDPGLSRLSIDGHEVTTTSAIAAAAGAKCSVALRPEALALGSARESDRNQMIGTAEEISFLGAVVRIRVRFGAHAVSIDTFNDPNTPPPLRGTRVAVTFRREDLLVLESTGRRPDARLVQLEPELA
ncbi:MAG: ABC transporter ATP-binding protein [Ancalomicrobiaceae bacterium]|nr:ABC transporter ATP-binding protein [Ancalomicrobiaceae bacterium]